MILQQKQSYLAYVLCILSYRGTLERPDMHVKKHVMITKIKSPD